jgi:hypothetical protein
LTSTQRSDNKNEEQEKLQYEAHQQEATYDHDPSIQQYIHAGGKEKTKGNNSKTQSSTTFHKDKVFTKRASSLTGLWAKSERVHYKRKKRLQGKSKVYATSAAGSAAEEGAGEVAPALGGGIDTLVVGVEEKP